MYSANEFPVKLFTLFVIIEYHFLVSINLNANSHCLGSAKAWQWPYSDICYFGLVLLKMKEGF